MGKVKSRYGYNNMIKEAVRYVIRDDIENITKTAVTAAAKSIENRGVKKLLEQIQQEA